MIVSPASYKPTSPARIGHLCAAQISNVLTISHQQTKTYGLGRNITSKLPPGPGVYHTVSHPSVACLPRSSGPSRLYHAPFDAAYRRRCSPSASPSRRRPVGPLSLMRLKGRNNSEHEGQSGSGYHSHLAGTPKQSMLQALDATLSLDSDWVIRRLCDATNVQPDNFLFPRGSRTRIR